VKQGISPAMVVVVILIVVIVLAAVGYCVVMKPKSQAGGSANMSAEAKQKMQEMQMKASQGGFKGTQKAPPPGR